MNDALEIRVPVSSLMGMTTFWAPAGEGTAEVAAQEPRGRGRGTRAETTIELSFDAARLDDAQPLASVVVRRAADREPVAKGLRHDLASPLPAVSTGRDAIVDLFQTTVSTISPVSSGAAAESLSSQPIFTSSFAGSQPQPAAAPARPQPAGIATPDEAGIRPMTLAPISPSGSVGAGYSTIHVFSGGGDPPEDMPPELEYSGGSFKLEKDPQGNPIPGKYYVENPIPIGTKIFIHSKSPTPAYVIQSYAWSGGTEYSEYTSVTPVTTVTGGQELQKNVEIHSNNYEFIVDATPRDYTAKLNVVYDNGAKGEATLRFTSVAPSGNLSVSQVGSLARVAGNRAGVGVNPEMKIRATTSTGDHTQGSFMFLQIVSTAYMSGRVGNISFYRTNDKDWANDPAAPKGENFDGPLHDGGSIGYGFRYVSDDNSDDDEIEYYGWYLNPNRTMPTEKSGTPEISDQPAHTLLLQDGLNRVDGASLFTTYLMYKPPNGVWIALQAIDWSFAGTVTFADGAWSGPNPGPVFFTPAWTPTEGTAFPTWVNIAGKFDDNELNPLRFGNPGP